MISKKSLGISEKNEKNKKMRRKRKKKVQNSSWKKPRVKPLQKKPEEPSKSGKMTATSTPHQSNAHNVFTMIK